VRYISKFIRGEHDYKANTEVLFDKIADLIEKGLDDAAGDWNDAKKAELNKHIKSQKRSLRKKKKAKPQSENESGNVEPSTDIAQGAEKAA
jgi:hypothetical protein